MADPQEMLGNIWDYVGTEAFAAIVARDPVNMPTIRRWCDAIGETNPLYLDPTYAAETEFGEPVAPPAMLQVWTMGHFDPDRKAAGNYMPVMAALAARGYTSAVATGVEHDYLRYLQHGDLITCRGIVEAISEEKKTSLGTGFFVTIRYEFINQHNDLMAVMSLVLLKFRPTSENHDGE